MSPFCLHFSFSKSYSRLHQKLKTESDTAVDSGDSTWVEVKTPTLCPIEHPWDDFELRNHPIMNPLEKLETAPAALREFLLNTTGPWSYNKHFTFIKDSRLGAEAIKLYRARELINNGQNEAFSTVLVSILYSYAPRLDAH
jgi:hypothetical protein